MHEVVQVGVGGFCRVDKVRLLDGHQQGGRQQLVAKHKLAGGDVHLDDGDEVAPVLAQDVLAGADLGKRSYIQR